MQRWEAENPQYRFGKVPYSLDRYGVADTQVIEAFAPYIERFGAWLSP
jgi:hypothetical protein